MNIGGNSQAQLRSIIERVEKLTEEKDAIASDIRDIYAESKANGFDVAALRAIVKMRKEDATKREERETIIATYMNALGMLGDMPLGQAAVVREFGQSAEGGAN